MKNKMTLFDEWEQYTGSHTVGVKTESRVIDLNKEKPLSRLLPAEWSSEECALFIYSIIAEYGKDLTIRKRHYDA